MPINDADLQFRQSERMTDFPDGGGRMSTAVVVSGVKNNLFPDITDIDRLAGRVSLRKVFAAALNADTDPLLSAHVLLDAPPEDAATSACIFSTGGVSTTREQAVAALEAWHRMPQTQALGITGSIGTLTARVVRQPGSNAPAPVPGMVLGLARDEDDLEPTGLERKTIATVAFVGTQGGGAQLSVWNVTFTAALVRDYPSIPFAEGQTFEEMSNNRLALAGVVPTEVRPYGVATAPGSTDAAATSITVDATSVQVVPYAGGDWPATAEGIDPQPFEYCLGLVPCIRAGDAVLIHHTEAEDPATVSNAQTVDVGRTGLARLRVIGATGVEHFRATAGQAPIGSGATADLAAGTVTFSDVSGMSQPVTIEHRIEEMALCTATTGTSVSINRALSRAYPAGARVSSLLMRGDLQGRAADGFAQQAWTGVWADSVIGGTPVGDFNEASHPVATTNAGAVTQRWAAIFTNTTAYRVIGEDLGEIGTGSTGADFSPLNPATGQPYFTLPALAWGSGWAAGNVYRWNTTGANSPVWALRCVAPSEPAGGDAVTLQLRGYVNT